ncbi:DUF2057 domain-containing protein [Shewanella sp. VB17]|uniref:DUF2057 domain-containing protein n=1 Tax=Shewanella sp. VB17 TaxID=2739432 RepID=UPI0015662E72|nr:DUF2057 domain-containing protein [Shewanella sp. VB17]NRD73504.1 DUF2057 domain-containing protein [Shewanella sp. VB17]
MKSVMPITAIIALLSSSSVLAASLHIPMSFEYLAVDGTKIASSLFSHQSDIELENGNHKIAIRYHDLIQDDFSDAESFIKSSPFIITLTVDGDHHYTLTAADGEVIKHPVSFAKSPQVVITRNDSGTVNYSVKQTDFTEDSFVNHLFGGGTSQNATNLINTTTKATMMASVTAPVSKAAPMDAITGTQVNKALQSEQMLQYWWSHADPKTRKEFMSWAIKQL